MSQQCVNCPGAVDHSTAECPMRASLPVGVPDGYRWHLVPKEDTDAFNAACSAANDAHLGGVGPCGVFIAGYRAMLAAAPIVKAEQVRLPERKRTDHLPADYKTMTPTRAAIESYNRALDDVAALNAIPAPSLPAAGSEELTAVRCQCCATEYPHDSYDAGFIAGSGMCQVCDAAMPPKDLPAAGSAVEEVEPIGYAWINRYNQAVDHVAPFPPTDGGVSYGERLMTVAQHERIVAALSAQQSAPERVSVDRSLIERFAHGRSSFEDIRLLQKFLRG